jgi:hypothetical protein
VGCYEKHEILPCHSLFLCFFFVLFGICHVSFFSLSQYEDKDEGVEFIFISGDHDEVSFDAYRRKMSFPAVPYNDAKVHILNTHFFFAKLKMISCIVFIVPRIRIHVVSAGIFFVGVKRFWNFLSLSPPFSAVFRINMINTHT